MRAQNKKEKETESTLISASDIKKEQIGDKFPFLRIPDNPEVLTMLDAEIKEKTKIQEEQKKSNAEITDMMATLESLAPSKLETAEKSSKRKRSRSPHRRSRDRERDGGRGRGRRSRSRDKRSRSRDRDRRSRSRDRSHRDRRRDRRSHSRSRSAEREKRREYIRQEKPYLSDKLPPLEPEVGKVS